MQEIQFANDQAMIANTAERLPKIIDEASRIVKNYGIKVNIK